jgi:hypothetical protein
MKTVLGGRILGDVVMLLWGEASRAAESKGTPLSLSLSLALSFSAEQGKGGFGQFLGFGEEESRVCCFHVGEFFLFLALHVL